MSIPNDSEKSVALDRQENITKGNVSAKRVALFTYNSGSDTLEPYSASGSTTYITIIREDAGDPNISYIGKAVPGTATSDAAWQIASLDENTNLDLLYADGGAFTQVYDDRESLTYA